MDCTRALRSFPPMLPCGRVRVEGLQNGVGRASGAQRERRARCEKGRDPGTPRSSSAVGLGLIRSPGAGLEGSGGDTTDMSERGRDLTRPTRQHSTSWQTVWLLLQQAAVQYEPGRQV